MQQVGIALRINTTDQQCNTFYSRSASLYYTAGQQCKTFYRRSESLPFSWSATQYKSDHIKSQLNRNWNTGVNAEAISPQYPSKTASPLYISARQHRRRPCRFQQNSIAHVYYIPAEQHRTLGVVTPGSGGPSQLQCADIISILPTNQLDQSAFYNQQFYPHQISRSAFSLLLI